MAGSLAALFRSGVFAAVPFRGLAVALSVAGVPPALTAQQAAVRVQENLRAEPNGTVVAVLEPGTPLAAVQSRGNWVEVVVEGWVWSASLADDGRPGFDHRVSADGGENLRSAPRGAVLGRLLEGALLEELERAPGWIRVRRQAWIWSESVTEAAPGPAAATPPGRASAGPSGAAPRIFRSRSGAAILAAPDGDTLVPLPPGLELPVTAREGNWARVRLDGWVWLPAGEAGEGVGSGDGAEPGPTLAVVMGDPGAFVGRLVTWDLQFVSVEAAEAVRTDFYEGEPFLLTRPLGEGEGRPRFVYVALPPDAVVSARGLTPLERITVVGRIRTGASALTGAPILDLVELRRGGGDGG
ncbi:MAG: hypothetical protein RQ751_12485 [Longimicrobiales bacterium]|nr:hypothetical protein [Longimicrobiales bacterium]